MARKPKAAEVAEFDPPIGHNRRPEDIEAALDLTDEEWQLRLGHIFGVCAARVDALLAADARFKEGYPLTPGEPPAGIEKWSDEVMARAADLREKFRAVMKTIDALHELEKAPVLRAGKFIDGAKNRLLGKILHLDSRGKLIRGADAPLNRISDRCTLYATWVDGERKRQAAAEAERLRNEAEVAAEAAIKSQQEDVLDYVADKFRQAEEAQKAAAAPPADRTRVHGVASVMSLRTTWIFDEAESDLAALVKAVAAGEVDLKYLAFNSALIGQEVRAGTLRELPGCVIREEKKV